MEKNGSSAAPSSKQKRRPRASWLKVLDALAEVLNADSEGATPNDANKKRRKRKVGGATVVDAKVERNITKVPVPDEERICALCGGAKTVFETVEHQRIEFVPAKIVLHIEQREKMTCLPCIDKLERGHALSRMSELTPASWAANQAR